jgi:hypothetical protein
VTFTVGQSGHIGDGHNATAKAINDQLERFGKARSLEENHGSGDPAHIDAHNAFIDALTAIATAAAQTFTPALPPKRALGDPHHTDDHNAITAAIATAASWPAWNSATGGTITDVPNYNGTGQTWRVHVCPGDRTFTVRQATGPFRVLLAGGGGGGGAGGGGWASVGGGGGGGEVWEGDLTIPVGDHAVVVGLGGGNDTTGSPTSLGSLKTVRGGGKGGMAKGPNGEGGANVGGAGGGGDERTGGVAVAGQGANGGNGGGLKPRGGGGGGGGATATAGGDWSTGTGGLGLTSTITGASVQYGNGGEGGYGDKAGAAGAANTGNGGGGGQANASGPGGRGGKGIAVIAYRIG